MNSKKTLSFVFIDSKLLVLNQQRPQNNIQHGVSVLPRLPNELCVYVEEQQSLIISSEHGQHVLHDLHHVEFNHSDYELLSLREALFQMPAADFQHVAQAWQYALFLRTHRYCGRCGEAMRRVNWEMAMHCDKCGHRVYPRVSPCIIVAIHNGKQILLAQGSQQKAKGYYSTLAGFVESAESLEQAVHREVMEEVGVTVGNIEYFSSQAWPFPHAIMVGYIAKHKSGEIKVDGREIIDAQWFDIDNMPNVPAKHSIAGHLIEETVRRIKHNDTI